MAITPPAGTGDVDGSGALPFVRSEHVASFPTTELRAVGFGWALGLNTGAAGAAQNGMQVYVRSPSLQDPSAVGLRAMRMHSSSASVSRSHGLRCMSRCTSWDCMCCR